MTNNSLLIKLADAFTSNGIVGYGLKKVIDREAAYSSSVEKKYKGYSVLFHSFQEFYMDSIELAGAMSDDPKQKPPPVYWDIWLWHLGCFRALRSTDILFHSGYPLEGVPRLRFLKESAVFIAAIHTGKTTYDKLMGAEGTSHGRAIPSKEAMDQIRKKRQNEERKLLGLTLRKKSGLTQEQQAELERWESFFNMETHNGFLTQALEFLDRPVSVAPNPSDDSCSLFINRFCEIQWMLHRTIPFLQLSTKMFNDEWHKKWNLLNQSFQFMQQNLADTGKPIGTVFIEFMELKFPFTFEDNFGKKSGFINHSK